jgi:hypothetical protein
MIFISVITPSCVKYFSESPMERLKYCLGRSPQSLLRLRRNALRIREKGQSLSTANTHKHKHTHTDTHTDFVGKVFLFPFPMPFYGKESLNLLMRFLSRCCKYEFELSWSEYQPFKAQWQLYVPPALTINNSAFCIYGFRTILTVNRMISLYSVNQLIFVMEKCCFLCGRTFQIVI